MRKRKENRERQTSSEAERESCGTRTKSSTQRDFTFDTAERHARFCPTEGHRALQWKMTRTQRTLQLLATSPSTGKCFEPRNSFSIQREPQRESAFGTATDSPKIPENRGGGSLLFFWSFGGLPVEFSPICKLPHSSTLVLSLARPSLCTANTPKTTVHGPTSCNNENVRQKSDCTRMGRIRLNGSHSATFLL